MSILMGHASIDENGKISGGSAGDQTGKEVCTRTWYSKPWDFMAIYPDATVREKIAKTCEAACANDKIGYDQNQRNTLYTQAKAVNYDLSKITTACECDCSSLMNVCCVAAGVGSYGSNGWTTSTMKSALTSAGFKIITSSTYLTSSAYCVRGAIYVKAGSHTTCGLTDGGSAAKTLSAAGISTTTTALYPDISHYNPVKDWSKIKKTCPFLISKATQRQDFVSSYLDEFIKGCEENKIPYWVYTYLEKGNEKAQAEFMVKTCKDKVGDYFVGYILDIEESNTASNVQSALDYLTGLGGKTMIYTMYSQYDTYKSVITGRPSTCAWWEARYGKNDGSYNSSYPPHSDVDLHQYTDKGTCDGLTNSGATDLNRLTGNKDESWFTDGKATTTTTSSTTTTSTTSSSTTLTVDGSIGKNTVKRLQAVLGTTQDSKISGQESKYKTYWASISSSVCSWSGGSSAVVKALQKKVGATQDGVLGQATAKATQKYLINKGYSCGSSGADGKFGTNSAKALQKWLNAQK